MNRRRERPVAWAPIGEGPDTIKPQHNRAASFAPDLIASTRLGCRIHYEISRALCVTTSASLEDLTRKW